MAAVLALARLQRPGSRHPPAPAATRATGSSCRCALDEAGAQAEAVYAQHSGAERCGWERGADERRRRAVAYLANGSHASYFRPGVRDRGSSRTPTTRLTVRSSVPAPAPGRDLRSARPAFMRTSPADGAASRAELARRSRRARAGRPSRARAGMTRAAFAAECARLPKAGRCDELGECDGRELALAGGDGGRCSGMLGAVPASPLAPAPAGA